MHFKEAKGILSANNGINVFRGCTHGCIYCDSRSKCYQINHEFTDIEVKRNAPALLQKALLSKREKCMIGTGSMTDPYLQAEASLNVTRRCLEIIEKNGFGVAIITKSDLVLRDLDLLAKINENAKTVVQITLTTYDEKLCKIIEPNVCTTKRRFEVLKILRDRGIPTVVWLDPILPFINDTEENLRGILNYCVEAKVVGIICFGFGLTLREGNREYFYEQLDKHFPGLKEKYIAKYGEQYNVGSPNNNELMKIFESECQKYGIMSKPDEVFSYLRQFPSKKTYEQLTLF